jgi:hypothetical protein
MANPRRNFHNDKTGRHATMEVDRHNGVVVLTKTNGDLRMGEEAFDINDDEKGAREEAMAAGEAFVAGQTTNVEFVVRMMEWAKSGPLMQAFIIDALHKQANAVAAATPADCESAMVSGAAWHACGVELANALKERGL